MSTPRRGYRLRDLRILHWLMRHPGRGVPYSIRSLAVAAGFKHHAKIGHLHSGQIDELEPDEATRVAEALGVALLVLFEPPTSPNPNGSTPEPASTAPVKEQ